MRIEGVNLKRILQYPLKIIFSSANLEMILDDSEINLAIANHREDCSGRDRGDTVIILESKVLDKELLLVDSRRCKNGRLDALVEPPIARLSR